MAKETVNQGKQGGRSSRDLTGGKGKKDSDAATSAVGDNRRAGDLDGNKTGADSKSPGATEATDESDSD